QGNIERDETRQNVAHVSRSIAVGILDSLNQFSRAAHERFVEDVLRNGVLKPRCSILKIAIRNKMSDFVHIGGHAEQHTEWPLAVNIIERIANADAMWRSDTHLPRRIFVS